MDNIAELERRITAALTRIGTGVEALSMRGIGATEAPVATLADGVAEAEIARLNEALDEERMLTAQLNERLRVVRGQDSAKREAFEAEIARLSHALDVQGQEAARLKRTVGSLREQLRLMTEAQAEGRIEPHLINTAMLTELEALRALRAAEASELNDLLAALDPLVTRLEPEATHA